MPHSRDAHSDGKSIALVSTTHLADVGGHGNVGLAWAMVCLAAASTWLGACVAFVNLRTEHERLFIAGSIAAAGGVMLYLCLADLSAKAVGAFEAAGYVGDDGAEAVRYATLAFFGGDVFFYIASVAADAVKPRAVRFPIPPVPQTDVVAEVSQRGARDLQERPADVSGRESKSRAMQMGLKAAFAIALHNFPEGLAGWMSTYAHGRSGMSITFGIILHNIPEGLCVALPIYAATQSRCKALSWASVAAAAEILGGLVAATMIQGTGRAEPQLLYGILFGLVQGMVTAVVVLEFIPHAIAMEPAGCLWPTCFFLGMVLIAITIVIESH